MVNADDPALRANRLALLAQLHRGDEPRRRPVAAGVMTPTLAARAAARAARPAWGGAGRASRHAHPKLVILGRDGILNEYREDHVNVARGMASRARRAGGGGAAEPRRLACGGGHQPVRHRPRHDRHGRGQCHARPHEPVADGAGRAHRRRLLLPAHARGRLRLPQAQAGHDAGDRPPLRRRPGAGADGRATRCATCWPRRPPAASRTSC